MNKLIGESKSRKAKGCLLFGGLCLALFSFMALSIVRMNDQHGGMGTGEGIILMCLSGIVGIAAVTAGLWQLGRRRTALIVCLAIVGIIILLDSLWRRSL